MPTLDQHQSNKFVKLLLLGDSKAGKTTALVSLVDAGYKLRVLDYDNLLDPLKHAVAARCPAKASNVEYCTLRDKYKTGALGAMVDGKPDAWVRGIKLLEHWKYDDVDLGPPADWGPDSILVVDSLSRMCDAAFNFHMAITKNPDQRAIYKSAQDDVERVLAMLTADGMETNIVVICHGLYLDLEDGTTKIFPQGVGSKLSPKIPQYFPVYIRFKNQGGKRSIQIKSDAMIDLACPKQIDGKNLTVEDGLAEIFGALRETPTQKPRLVRKV